MSKFVRLTAVSLIVGLISSVAYAGEAAPKAEEFPVGFCNIVLATVKAQGHRAILNSWTYKRALSLATAQEIVDPKHSDMPPGSLRRQFSNITSHELPSAELFRDIVRIFLKGAVATSERGKNFTPGQDYLMIWLTGFGRSVRGNPEVQDLLVEAIKKMAADPNQSIRVRIERFLFDLAAYPEVGFAKSSVELFDTLPLDDKVALVNYQPFHMNEFAVNLMREWRAPINLENLKQRIAPALEEAFSSGNSVTLLRWINDTTIAGSFSFAGDLGYDDRGAMVQAVSEQARSLVTNKNGVIQALHQLIQYRISYGFNHLDRQGPAGGTRIPRFIEPATYMTLLIFSRIAQGGAAYLSPEEREELRTLLRSIATSEARTILKQGLTTATDMKEPLSWPIRFVGWGALDRFVGGDFGVDVLADFSSTLSYALRNHMNWRMPEQ
jgi:hypothetical protein